MKSAEQEVIESNKCVGNISQQYKHFAVNLSQITVNIYFVMLVFSCVSL